MAGKKGFEVPFSGLKEGTYDYQFNFDKSFFEERDYSEIKDGQADINVELNRQTRMLIFDISIEGSVTLPCDLCGDPVTLPIQTEQQLIVKLGDQFSEESEDVLMIPENDGVFDLSQYIYEYFVIAVPVIRKHPDGECNEETLKRLHELQVKQEKQGPEDIDPRWDKLRDLN